MGGYPKIEALRRSLGSRVPDKGKRDGFRILVILSWGVDPAALGRLPDQSHIDYLLHPADWRLAAHNPFHHARLNVSGPRLTDRLIDSASIIVGDFSSLSLECLALGKRVIFMMDRALYNVGCDLDPAFFERGSDAFGLIPESVHRVATDQTVSMVSLAKLVEDCADDPERWEARAPLASFPELFLPPSDQDNRASCATKILEIAHHQRGVQPPTPASGRSRENLADLRFLLTIFHLLLRREADGPGLNHYLARLQDSGRPLLERLLMICHSMNESPEARSKRPESAEPDPISIIIGQLRQEGEHDPARAADLVDAIADRLLAERLRRNWDKAADDPDVIATGTRLVAARLAEPGDLVRLAHAHARSEQLGPALQLVEQAEQEDPANGELLRFKASLLERLRKWPEALGAAHSALAAGADERAIRIDIERLESRRLSVLRQRSISENELEPITDALHLLATGELSLRTRLSAILHTLRLLLFGRRRPAKH